MEKYKESTQKKLPKGRAEVAEESVTSTTTNRNNTNVNKIINIDNSDKTSINIDK